MRKVGVEDIRSKTVERLGCKTTDQTGEGTLQPCTAQLSSAWHDRAHWSENVSHKLVNGLGRWCGVDCDSQERKDLGDMGFWWRWGFRGELIRLNARISYTGKHI